MTTEVSDSFIIQFEREVHLQFQQMGSQLMNFCRRKSNVRGYKTTFQVAGKGVATKKNRHGDVQPMNADRTPVEVTLEDWYAPEYVDKLDELKLNHDEQTVCARTCAAALGRKADALIIAALDAGTYSGANVVGDGTTALTRNMALQVTEGLRATGYRGMVPDVVACVGNREWSSLMTLDEFVDADKIGVENLPYKNGAFDNRSWMGVLWMWHPDLTTNASGHKLNYMWHRDALACAFGQDVMTEINYVPQKVAHLVTSIMSLGAKIIDNTGIVQFKTDADIAIPT